MLMNYHPYSQLLLPASPLSPSSSPLHAVEQNEGRAGRKNGMKIKRPTDRPTGQADGRAGKPSSRWSVRASERASVPW